MSDLELPIEDTQDLLMNNSPGRRSRAESTPRIQSQSFHFSLNYESQSQMLDDDGSVLVVVVVSLVVVLSGQLESVVIVMLFFVFVAS